MTRITNELFESIQKVLRGDSPIKENKDVVEGQVDKAHYCATHVEHPIFGDGECIAEAHADPDAEGNIAWYTVKFSDGIRKVYTEAMKVKKAKMHEHAEVTDEMIDQEVADMSDEEFEETLQEALALDEASYSAKAARAGKDIGKPGKMFGKIAASAAKRYGSAERGKKVAGAVLAKLRAKSMEEALAVSPVSHVSPSNPNSSKEDEKNRKASLLIDKIRSFRQLKQDYKEKGNSQRHKEFHDKLHDADKEYQKLGHKSLLKKDDHILEEVEQTNEGAMSDLDADRKDRAYQSRQARTTMKHIPNPTPGEKEAARDIKPGIAGYRDRIAMLKSAQARGGMKEGMDPVGKEDSDVNNDGKKDSSDSYLLNRRKAIKKSMMKESVPFTIVIENQYNVDIPTNLTYSDYLDAVKTIISSDDPEFQQDIVNIAAEAFDTGKIEIIAEALLIKQGVLEAYRSTADYGNQKLYSKELSGTVDRSKPGVVKFSRDTQQTIGMDQKTRKAKKEREAKVFGNK